MVKRATNPTQGRELHVPAYLRVGALRRTYVVLPPVVVMKELRAGDLKRARAEEEAGERATNQTEAGPPRGPEVRPHTSLVPQADAS